MEDAKNISFHCINKIYFSLERRPVNTLFITNQLQIIFAYISIKCMTYTYVYIELEEKEKGASTNLLIAILQILSLESWPGVNNQLSGDNCTVISSSRLWLLLTRLTMRCIEKLCETLLWNLVIGWEGPGPSQRTSESGHWAFSEN